MGARFCWHCGFKLRGNHFAEFKTKLGQPIKLHKECLPIVKGDSFDFKVDAGEIKPELRKAQGGGAK